MVLNRLVNDAILSCASFTNWTSCHRQFKALAAIDNPKSENCILQGYYTAGSGNYGRSGTTYRTNLQRSRYVPKRQ